MGERKVLNKYFAPDFDPSKVPRRKLDRDGPIEIRTMLPFNMCCLTCGHYMYRGKKFIAKKETAKGEEYLGRIKVFRFYIKCEACKAQITFKTDPKNTDYVCESGASRNFETWRNTGDDDNKELVEEENVDEDLDALETLERRTLESKREMDTLDALEEIRRINQTRSKLTSDQVIEKLRSDTKEDKEKLKETEDAQLDAEAARVFQEKRKIVKRIDDTQSSKVSASGSSLPPEPKPEKDTMKLVRVKRKLKEPIIGIKKTNDKVLVTSATQRSSGLGLLGGYSDDSSEEE